MSKNNHLARTRKTPNDEFYTIYSDIEKELGHYKSSFAGKIVYCNCDDENSQFTRFFTENFEQLGLSKLICSGISGLYTEFDGNTTYATTIDGDFRSNECQAVLDCADVVVTNPPFSLFNEFFSTVTEHGKDFLVIGPKTAVSYSSVFPMFHEGRCSIGHTCPDHFTTPSASTIKLPGLSRWFTTFGISGKKFFTPTASVKEHEYQYFDLYPAINVDHTAEIPYDYYDEIGVPVTAIEKLDPTEYEFVDMIARYAVIDHSYDTSGHQLTEVNGEPKFSRLIIKKKTSK